MNDVRRYRANLRRAKYASLIDLKAGFHNVVMDKKASYYLTFVYHRGKYRWLRMPFGLT